MAGEWVKMRTNLLDDPRVVAMATALEQPETFIVGCLFALWSMADNHSETGALPRLTARAIDRRVGLSGFSLAASSVGWLELNDTGATIPRFHEHNGASAKARATTARRVLKHRDLSDCNGATVTDSDMSVTSPLTRRREEKKEKKRGEEEENAASPSPPPGPTQDQFLESWNAVSAFTACRGMTGDRLRHFQARSRDRDWSENWREALAKAAQSPFCLGQNDRGWRATVDWFLRPGTVTKILEGAYSGGPKSGPDAKPNDMRAKIDAALAAAEARKREGGQ